MAISRDDIVKILGLRLNSLPHFVKAILLFGSYARNEADERSDIDLLILYEDLNIDNPIERRRFLYKLIMNYIGDLYDAVTVIDMRLKDFLNPKNITPLLLNIYWDSIIIIDRTGGRIELFLKHIRRKILKAGLKRIKDNKGYYWRLPKPMQRIRIL